MGAAVRLEASVWTDPRFDRLARALKCHRDVAVCRMARLWSFCTERGVYVVDPMDAAVFLECDDDFVIIALCDKANLGVAGPEGIRVRGTKGRTEWLGKLRMAASAGGASRQRDAQRNVKGEFVRQTTEVQPPASHCPALHGRVPTTYSDVDDVMTPS